jgi:hypothetical protein
VYHEDAAKILFKLLNVKGVINIGGKSQNIYDFVRKDNKDIKRRYLKKTDFSIPNNSSLNLLKLKNILKKNKI